MAFIALKQTRADFFFECLDLGAQRGLRDMEFHGRATETQFLGNGNEILELTQFHNRQWL